MDDHGEHSLPRRSDLGRTEGVPIQLHRAPQHREGGVHVALHPHPVFLLHLVAGVEKGVGQRPVVGEEEQPLGVQIQPPNRPHPGAAAGHQLRHGAPWAC